MPKTNDRASRYIAVKIDVIASRRVEDRAALQSRLFETADACNRAFKSATAADFVVTHGDEIQGMFYDHAANQLWACLEHWLDRLRPHDIRFGVGIGPLSTPLKREAIGMDGPCWHRAQTALDLARRHKRTFQLVGLAPEQDRPLNALANLLFVIATGWTTKQAMAVGLNRRHATQLEAAARMGITAATFSKHLSSAHWHEFEEGHHAFTSLLQMWLTAHHNES